MLIIREFRILGFSWRVLRERNCAWYYLERDGEVIAEGNRDEIRKLELDR